MKDQSKGAIILTTTDKWIIIDIYILHPDSNMVPIWPTMALYLFEGYYTILYYTILYYTILYYTILYYTILYYMGSFDPLKGDIGLL